jgi:pimeloyl-ACP methyl ester carboxylesterase
MIEHLRHSFHCFAFDLRGHGHSSVPPNGDFDWRRFATDALAVRDAFDLHRPLVFGHSCGGAVLLLATITEPSCWSAIYAFEPVVVPNLGTIPNAGEDHPLAAGALRRRREFPDRDMPLANYASKPPFEIVERLPSGQFDSFPGLGHLGPLEDPDGVARRVTAALS